MEMKHKILGFAVMCGFALAASVETREHFDASSPLIFYGIHGAFILGSLVALITAWRIGSLSGVFALRVAAAMVALYAVAATRASVAPLMVAAVGIATIAVWVISSNRRNSSHISGMTG